MKKIVLSALVIMSANVAFAKEVQCIDNQNSDKIITLELQDHQIVTATYSDQNHGIADDKVLESNEYVVYGDGIVYQNELYNCRY